MIGWKEVRERMEIDVREVIANIEQYEDWDYKAYPLQKDEADIILKILKGGCTCTKESKSC